MNLLENYSDASYPLELVQSVLTNNSSALCCVSICLKHNLFGSLDHILAYNGPRLFSLNENNWRDILLLFVLVTHDKVAWDHFFWTNQVTRVVDSFENLNDLPKSDEPLIWNFSV